METWRRGLSLYIVLFWIRDSFKYLTLWQLGNDQLKQKYWPQGQGSYPVSEEAGTPDSLKRFDKAQAIAMKL